MDLLEANDRPGVYPPSWYAATCPEALARAAAKGRIDTDVAIIGGGYSGLSAALHLAQRGYDTCVLEANRVGWGASGRNGGQVVAGQRLDQHRLEKMVGHERARALWALSLESVALVKALIKEHAINASFVPGVIHACHRARYVAPIHTYIDYLHQVYNYALIDKLDRHDLRQLVGSPAYFGGMLDRGSGHIHPLAYALGLAGAAERAGARLFENTRVRRVEAGSTITLETGAARVRARFALVACNGYSGRLVPGLARHVMPINNFIAATPPLGEDLARRLIRDDHAVADSRHVVNYFRLSHDRRLLFGGGESYFYKFPADIGKKVRRKMLAVFPQLEATPIAYAWGGTLGITMSRMPHFCRLRTNMLSVGGFSGHGVAMASLAGALAAEAIDGQASRFDIFSSVPTPAFPGGALLRWPMLVLAMAFYSMKDRL